VAGGERLLYTDDFQAAATGPAYGYMRLLGHLPALVAASQENAVNVCFGTGTTAGALAAHAGVRRLEVVETSEAVLALAPHFRAVNRDVLEDPRVRVRVADGRHALALHARDLDVVTLEPLMPYTPAALPFYTREFYALAKDRLREGGVLCQWIPVHAMPLDLYQALATTFFEAFPDSTLWFFEQSTVLVGRKGTARPTVETMRARAAEVAKELVAAGLGSPAALGVAYVTTGERFLAAVRARPAGPLSLEPVTDERPFPEAYPAPRAGLLTPYLRETLAFLASLVAPGDPLPREVALVPDEFVPRLREAARRGLEARAREAEAQALLALAAGRGAEGASLASHGVLLLEEAVQGYEEASGAARGEDTALRRREARARRQLLGIQARVRMRESRSALAAGDASLAREKAEEAHRLARRAYEPAGPDALSTERPEAAVLLGEALVRLGRCRSAETLLTSASRRWPFEPRLRALLAAIHAQRLGRDPSGLGADAQAFFRSFGPAPCDDVDLGPAEAAIDRFAEAMRRGRPGHMRLEAERILFVVRDRRLPGDAVALEVEATGDVPGPEAEAVRAALVRALRRDDPALPAMAGAGSSLPRRRAAFLEAARGGFGALGLEAVGQEASKDADPAVREALAEALALDPSPFARGLLGRLLSDEDASVRRRAYASAVARLPKDGPDAGYDPEGDPAEREAAAARLRERLAEPPR
jgi:spermidine synthase